MRWPRKEGGDSFVNQLSGSKVIQPDSSPDWQEIRITISMLQTGNLWPGEFEHSAQDEKRRWQTEFEPGWLRITRICSAFHYISRGMNYFSRYLRFLWRVIQSKNTIVGLWIFLIGFWTRSKDNVSIRETEPAGWMDAWMDGKIVILRNYGDWQVWIHRTGP